MENIWEQAKRRIEAFNSASAGQEDEEQKVIFCEAASLVLPGQAGDKTSSRLNKPLVDFLKRAKGEGFGVHVYAMNSFSASSIEKSLGADVHSIPCEIENYLTLVARYNNASRAMVISSNPLNNDSSNTPIVHWNPHRVAVKEYLEETFEM